MRPERQQAIEAAIGYRFRDTSRLEEALTHSSVNLQRSELQTSYQRLEFLGDSILGAVVSDMLFHTYPHEPEGKLAQRKSALVSGKTLVKIMDKLNLAGMIRMSESEIQSGGQQAKSVKEDVCEALIGALYLDGGFEAAQNFIVTHWQELVSSITGAQKDPKTALQEYVQGQGLPLPVYRLVAQEGLAHEPCFTIEVQVPGAPTQQATAENKRKAEKMAAQAMLEVLECPITE